MALEDHVWLFEISGEAGGHSREDERVEGVGGGGGGRGHVLPRQGLSGVGVLGSQLGH